MGALKERKSLKLEISDESGDRGWGRHWREEERTAGRWQRVNSNSERERERVVGEPDRYRQNGNGIKGYGEKRFRKYKGKKKYISTSSNY